MFPRVSIKPVTDTVVIKKSQLKYDLSKKDILLLEVEKSNYNIWALQTSFSLPTKGEKLYIIGCPYSEDNCKQNIYEVKFDSYDSETSMLISISNNKFEMAGFSGSPLVNSDGAVVGALTSGWAENNKFFVGATFIKEIQNVQ